MENTTQDITATIISNTNSVISVLPSIIIGLIVLVIGVVVASFVKKFALALFDKLKVERWISKYSVPEGSKFKWSEVFAELIRWFVIILFLIAAADIWNLPQITQVLNTFLLYLPQVFIAAMILVVGFAVANIAHDIILGSTKGMESGSSKLIAAIAKWSIAVFAILAALSQLGVATELIRILFTGFVAMVAIAGGLAFGLGGQEHAKEVLGELKKKIK